MTWLVGKWKRCHTTLSEMGIFQQRFRTTHPVLTSSSSRYNTSSLCSYRMHENSILKTLKSEYEYETSYEHIKIGQRPLLIGLRRTTFSVLDWILISTWWRGRLHGRSTIILLTPPRILNCAMCPSPMASSLVWCQNVRLTAQLFFNCMNWTECF